MLTKSDKNPFDLFRSRLTQILSHQHPLYKPAGQIDWSVFERAFGATYCLDNGRPAKPIRLLVGLHYLKHAYNESDESVVIRWLENPYWQYFCGMEYFQHELPCDPTLLVKWRQRVGAKKLEKLLSETVSCAKRERLIEEMDLVFVNVDTTVQEKNIAFPTDARLYDKCRKRLIAVAKKQGVRLHQTYAKDAKEALIKQHRYASARQFKRARKMTTRLKTLLGRVVRSIERNAAPEASALWREVALAHRLLSQKRNSKNKLYSLHEPEVQCIAKGKAHKRYEFGCKVGVVTTSETNWIVGVDAFDGNPFDGHTITQSLTTMKRIAGAEPMAAYCDRGYRGNKLVGETVIRVAGTGPRKKLRFEKYLSKRRASVEPTIGHLKSENRMNRNYLKGKQGDRINAVLAAAGYNLRKLIRAFFFTIRFRILKVVLRTSENVICQNAVIEAM